MLADPFVFPRLKRGDKRCLGFIEKLAKGDKFAIMMPNGKTHLIGKFIEDAGVWYSNNGYVYSPPKYKGKGKKKKWWNWRDEWDDGGFYVPDEALETVELEEIAVDDLMWDAIDDVGYSTVDDRRFAYDAAGALREVVYDAEINDFRFV
jgi:hypothetical protein